MGIEGKVSQGKGMATANTLERELVWLLLTSHSW